MTASASDFDRDIARLVALIMERDAIERGFALMIARGLLRAMPTEDALRLVKQQAKPIERHGGDFDPSTMIA